MTIKRFDELWSKVADLAWNSPYIYQSKYYQYKGAAEEVASTLKPVEAQVFLGKVQRKIQGYSNYAGD